MGLLSGFDVSLDEVNLLGAASRAAFEGAPIPSGWEVVAPEELGLAVQYRDGNYCKNGYSGASAIVLWNGSDFIVSFRGTDDQADVANYPRLTDGSYIDYFEPLLNAVANAAPADAEIYFTGASLGGGAVNNLARIASTAYGGRFADAAFVAFAAPNITDASGILNIGFENDPLFKAVNSYENRPSSLDNLVSATDEYLAGNYDGWHPYSEDAHDLQLGREALARLSASEFYEQMKPDSVVIFAASDRIIQDQHPGRSSTGAFYLGQGTADRIVGRAGNDFIEGFSGDDSLTGGAGNDRIKGGLGKDFLNGSAGADHLDGGIGNDRLLVTGTEAKLDKLFGGLGNDVLKVLGTGNLTLSGFNASASSIEIWQGNSKAVLGDGAANSFNFAGLSAVSGIDYVDAGAGNDTIVGSAFADVLRGAAGADKLTGGAGDDRLSGGSDFDTFNFAAGFGKDTIMDFAEGAGVQDVIRFDDAVFSDYEAVMAAAGEVGANVEIRLDADNVLTLRDVTLAGLVPDDFLFT